MKISKLYEEVELESRGNIWEEAGLWIYVHHGVSKPVWNVIWAKVRSKVSSIL